MRFRAEQHLRRQLDFQHVRNHGRRHECGAFTLWYVRQAAPVAVGEPKPGENPDVVTNTTAAASTALTSRLGVVASRSAVGNAIARARAKRRLREVFRGHQQRVPAGYDLLLVARGALNRLEYREIEKRFVDACSKIFPPAKA